MVDKMKVAKEPQSPATILASAVVLLIWGLMLIQAPIYLDLPSLSVPFRVLGLMVLFVGVVTALGGVAAFTKSAFWGRVMGGAAVLVFAYLLHLAAVRDGTGRLEETVFKIAAGLTGGLAVMILAMSVPPLFADSRSGAEERAGPNQGVKGLEGGGGGEPQRSREERLAGVIVAVLGLLAAVIQLVVTFRDP
ncbi:MAG: hypothetical protein M3R02_25460 [Chloroflexota bacterium]|nr:hypothetical protein [Chloroflexota bacterium]